MKKIFIIFLFLFSASVLAETTRKNANYGHLFGGVGPLYTPASFRLGGKGWELGLLNSGSFGILGLFDASFWYMGFGAGLIRDSFGPFASVGSEFYSMAFVSLRAEATTSVSIDNQSVTELLIGLNISL